MTQTATETRPGFLREVRDNLTRVAVPHHEPPVVIRRRRFAVAFVVVVGATLLGYSLARDPGDSSFYGLTLALAGVWAIGALMSGPLHLGCVRFFGRNQRPVITGTIIGLALGGVFVLGGLVAREIPALKDYAAQVLEFATQGSLPLVVFITVINGLAEELFFRGALYSAFEKHHPAIISTIVYTIAIGASTLNPMLTFAAIILGAVCAFERRATGGVLAPILTHMVWGLIMVLALPPVFDV
jgi:uncharacterized protein